MELEAILDSPTFKAKMSDDTPQWSAAFPSGYPSLAARMSLFPEIAIFNRFPDLTTRNLLYYQAQLMGMRLILFAMEEQDDTKPKSGRTAANWETLSNEPPNDHWALWLKIREVLEKYEEALIRAYQLSNYPEVKRSDFMETNSFIKGMGWPFGGADINQTYNEAKYSPHLMALRHRPRRDPFSNKVAKYLVQPFFQYIGKRFKKRNAGLDNEYTVKEDSLDWSTLFFTNFLVASISVVIMIVLYLIRPINVRLGAIAIFHILFSTLLPLFTLSSAIEMITATSAFAAVEVIFVSSNAISANGTAPSP